MAQLKLSTHDIAAALAGLSAADRDELLALLQQADEERAALPEDNRTSIDQMISQAKQAAAAKSGDPDRWLDLDAAYDTARSAHYRHLMAGHDMEDMDTYMAGALAAWHEASELADAESPHPDRPVKRSEPLKEADDLDDDPPPLPRATAADIAYSRAREAFAADPPSWIDGV